MVTTCDEKINLHEHEEGFQIVMIIKGGTLLFEFRNAN
jgi:hypothetical protein